MPDQIEVSQLPAERTGTSSDRRMAIGCMVDVWIDKGEDTVSFDGEGRIRCVEVSNGEPGPYRLIPVESGKAVVAPSASPVDGVYLEELLYGTVRAMPAGGNWVQPGVSEQRVIFSLQDAWFVETIGSDTGRALLGLKVLRGASPWVAPESGMPPDGVQPYEEEVNGSAVDLQPAPGCVYWFGSEGYAWFPFRWERRHLLGHRIALDPAAALTLVRPFIAAECWQVDLRSGGRIGYGRLLARYSWVGEDLGISPLCAGDFVLNVRAPECEIPIWTGPLTLFPGERKTLYIEAGCEQGDLEVRFCFARPRDLPLQQPVLTRLDKTRTWLQAPDETIQIEATVLTLGGTLVVSWEGLEPGDYLVRLSDLLFMVTVESGVTTHESFDIGPREVHDVYIVDAVTGEPVDVQYLQWSWIIDDEGIPSGILLPQGGAMSQLQGGVCSVDLPPGRLRIFLATECGPRFWVGSLSGAEQPVVVEIEPALECRLTIGDCTWLRIPLGFLGDVTFWRQGTRVPGSEVTIGARSRDGVYFSQGTLTVLGAPPDRMLLPDLDGISAGRWVEVPREHRTVTVDVCTGAVQ